MATKSKANVKPGSSIRITIPPPTNSRTRLWVRVRATHNAGFIAALKRSVPTPDRSWSPIDGDWSVHPDHLQTLRTLALSYFQNAYVIDGTNTTDLVRGLVHRQLEMFPRQEEA